MPFLKMRSHESLLEEGYTYMRPWASSDHTFWYRNAQGRWELWTKLSEETPMLTPVLGTQEKAEKE